MALTSGQKVAWANEILRRKSKTSAQNDEAGESGLDFDASIVGEHFYFNLTDDQAGDIYLLLKPLVTKYEPIYAELDESVRYLNFNTRIDKLADLEERTMSYEEREAVFLAYHSKDTEMHRMALSIIWYTNFKSILDWVAKGHEWDRGGMSYFAMFRSDKASKGQDKEGGSHDGDSERQEATLMLYDLYEQYDFLRRPPVTFNTYANYWIPMKIKEKTLPSGYSYSDVTKSKVLKGIRHRLSVEQGVAEDEVLPGDVIKEYTGSDDKVLYDEDGNLTERGNRFVEELERKGFQKDEITRDFIESEYAKAFPRRMMSFDRYDKLINLSRPNVSSIDEVIDKEDDDSQTYGDYLDASNKIGYSEDLLSPQEHFLRQEAENELRAKLLRLFRAIPHPDVMCSLVLDYADTDPVGRVRSKLKEEAKLKKSAVRNSDVRKRLKELFLDEISREYSAMCDCSLKTAFRYSEKAYGKFVLLDTDKRKATDLLLEVREDDVDLLSTDAIYADLVRAEKSRKSGKTSVSGDISDDLVYLDDDGGIPDDFSGLLIQ